MRLKKPEGGGLLVTVAAGPRAAGSLDRSEVGHGSGELQTGLASAAPLVAPLSDVSPIPSVGTWLTAQKLGPRAGRQPMLLTAVPASGRVGCCAAGTMGRARVSGCHCGLAGGAPCRAAGPHYHQGAALSVPTFAELVECSCWSPVGSVCTRFDAS